MVVPSSSVLSHTARNTLKGYVSPRPLFNVKRIFRRDSLSQGVSREYFKQTAPHFKGQPGKSV